ncbi:MAG: hypothetical protein HKN06_04160 [Gammaproteobacteria bacterium]|nr:hypothetical protein [Gammaproteobacteria bacterium]
MAIRLYNLRGVPDDEAEEMRQLLQETDIDFYETPPGNWGISAPAFWLRDEAELERAKRLIDSYQAQRAASAQEQRRRLQLEGRQQTIFDAFKNEPLKMIIYVLAALVVLYLSTKPFIDMN